MMNPIDEKKLEHADKVKKVIEYILNGLSENDAAHLAGYSTVAYDDMKEEFPKVADRINLTLVEYKHNLLKTLSAAANDGDEKLAQWLLEKQFPEEFNQKARAVVTEDTQGNLLLAAIRQVQEGNTMTTLIGIKRTNIVPDEETPE